MELIFGTLDAKDQRETERWLARCRVTWIEPDFCERAYQVLATAHLGNAIGVIDALVAEVAISLGLSLYTFNQKHFDVVSGLKTIRPYTR